MSKLRFWVSALAVTLVCAAIPQTKDGKGLKIPKLPAQANKQLTIDDEGSSDWRPSSLSSKLLLEKCDAWMSGLKNVSAQTRLLFDLGVKGDYGVWQGLIAIANSHKFRATFGNIFYKNGEIEMRRGEVIADGSRIQTYNQDGYSPSNPVTTPRLPKELLASWPERAQDLVFTEYGAGERPLSTLYRTAMAAGLHAVTEKRAYSYNGITAKEYRVLLTGNPVINGKRARYEVEILIDAPTGALLKLTQYRQIGKDVDNRYRSMWTVMWDRSPNQKFDPGIFTVSPIPAPSTPLRTR